MIYTLKELTNSKFLKIFFIATVLCDFSVAESVDIDLPKPSEVLMAKWKEFNKRAGKGIEEFSKEYLNEATQNVESVFYPFGGPDATFPILLFPTAKNFVIVGLEYPGQIEALSKSVDSKKMQEKSIDQVDSLLKRSFFITSQMGKQFSKETGIAAPLFLQLRLMGVEKVTVDTPDLPYSGIKISFDHGGVNKTIHYYRMDLSDGKIPQAFLEALKEKKLIDGCMIKSSSYIPHQKNFVKIRDFIKDNAKLIIQDDTGIPVKLLKNDFEVHLYGKYKGPYGRVFRGYKQNEKDMPKMETQVPFCFGYGCRAQNSVFMLAQREDKKQEDASEE